MNIVPSSRIPAWWWARAVGDLSPLVRTILQQVRTRGDVAVRHYTRRFDRVQATSFNVPRPVWRQAWRRLPGRDQEALAFAATRITRFAVWQRSRLQGGILQEPGLVLQQRLVPVKRAGCYAPGGRYPLASSVLMTVMPAKVAGVREVVVCSPPQADGRVAPIILAAAWHAQVDRVFAVGGAQAVAAMAYGTRSIPSVDVIAGPGNRWVTMAKQAVSGVVGTDVPAGPTELVVVADETALPMLVAADLVAQAEHAADAQVTLLTPSRRLAKLVQREVARFVTVMPTQAVVRASLARGLVIITHNVAEAVTLANRKAPEHLSLQVRRPDQWGRAVTSCGSLFLGSWSAVALGDYVTGPNHTLPTNGAARYTGGLSVFTFMKVMIVQRLTRSGAQRLIPAANRLAHLEGLPGHAASLALRKTHR